MNAAAKWVLLVEDDVELRALLVPRLEERGFSVECASGRAEARACLARRAFTIVVADASLPDGDGLALLDEIGAAQPRAALLLMSAFLSDLPSFASSGASAMRASVIAKPFAPEQFLAEVGLAIEAWAIRAVASDAPAASSMRPSAVPSELEEMLDALRCEYGNKLAEKLAELRASLVRSRETLDYESPLRLAHRLHGTAGAYGFAEVSQAAATIEHAMREAVRDGKALDPRRWPELDAALDFATRRTSTAAPPFRSSTSIYRR